MFLAVMLVAFASARVAAGDSVSILLKAGESPPKGWSVVIFQTEYGSGGRVKVGTTDTCWISFNSLCYFAVAAGPMPILVDMAAEYGDTTATISVSEQRIYNIKSVNNAGRGAARSVGGLVGGLVGALATQPDDSPAARAAAKETEVGPLTNVRRGSRYDLEFISASEPGKAAGFVRPADVPPATYPR